MSKIVVGKNPIDNLLELFVIGPDDYVYNIKQTENLQWGDWRIFEDSHYVNLREGNKGRKYEDQRAKELALHVNESQIELFVLRLNNKIYQTQKTRDKPDLEWTPWVEQDLELRDDFGMYEDRKKEIKLLEVTRKDKMNQDKIELELFYIYSNDTVFSHRRNPSGWDKGIQLAISAKNYDIANKKFEPGISYENDLECFITSSRSDREFGNINNLLTDLNAKELALGTNEDGRLELFIISNENGIYHFWQNENYDWDEKLVGYFDNKEAIKFFICQNNDDRLEMFTIGTNNKIYHFWQKEKNLDWHKEEKIGDLRAEEITAGINKDGKLELFVIGNHDEVYHFSQSDNWSNQESMKLNPYNHKMIESIWY